MAFLKDPFPKATAWISANSTETERAELDEYLEVIRYHLSLGFDSEQDASNALRPGRYGLSHTGDAVYLLGFDPANVVRHGDIAIREAGTVVDVALQFTSRALQLGLDKGTIRWGRDSRESPLRARLRKSATPADAPLMAAIDGLFDSIGLHLLHGYRHWVSHRGAPRIRLEHSLAEGIPLDAEIQKEADDRRKAWLIEKKLLIEIPAAIRIECYPFVPPVQSVINATVDEAEEDIAIAGVIHIGKGAKNIEIRDSTISTGSSLESVEAFTTKNPILREESKVRVAGEDLASYKAWDYMHALRFAMRFVTEALRGDWDDCLARALADRGAARAPEAET
jgi:hypothetical protein